MKINRIEIENFKSYYGIHKLEFASSSKRNITLILGANNSGKTALMEAIKWCLYDEAPEKGERGTFVNYEKGIIIKDEGEFRVAVTITMEHGGNTYRVIRKANIFDSGDCANPKSNLYIAVVSAKGTSKKMRANDDYAFQKIIDDILPHSISQYFIVDGDKIAEFVKPTASQTREAIENLLKFEHLRRASKHLSDLKNHLVRRLDSMTKGSKGDRNISDRHKALEQRITADQLIVIGYQDDEKRARAMLQDAEDRIAAATESLEKVKEIYHERDLNKEASQRLDGQLHELSKVFSIAYLTALLPTLKAVWVELNNNRIKGKLPKPYEDVFIKDMLKPCDDHGAGICICGTKFKLDSKQYKELKKVLESTPPKSLTDRILPLQILLKEAQKRANTVDQIINEYRDSIDGIEDHMTARQTKIDSLKKQIDAKALETAAPLLRQKEILSSEVEDLKGKISLLNHDITRHTRELQELADSIAKSSKSDKRTANLRSRIDLVIQSKKAVDEVYEKYKGVLRRELIEEISKIFMKIITAEENFSKFKIDEDFNYDILNKQGASWKLHLSNAQRKIFALSFVAGLRLVAEEQAPFILDSPLAVIDPAHRRNYAKVVPDISSQLVLLLTESEGTDEFLERIDSKVGAFWQITYDSSTNRSSLVRVK